jgi:hypothetical protein
MVLDLVSPELAREYRAKLDGLAERAGRRARRLAAWIPAAVDPDPESYTQIMQTWSATSRWPGTTRCSLPPGSARL